MRYVFDRAETLRIRTHGRSQMKSSTRPNRKARATNYAAPLCSCQSGNQPEENRDAGRDRERIDKRPDPRLTSKQQPSAQRQQLEPSPGDRNPNAVARLQAVHEGISRPAAHVRADIQSDRAAEKDHDSQTCPGGTRSLS